MLVVRSIVKSNGSNWRPCGNNSDQSHVSVKSYPLVNKMTSTFGMSIIEKGKGLIYGNSRWS